MTWALSTPNFGMREAAMVAAFLVLCVLLGAWEERAMRRRGGK